MADDTTAKPDKQQQRALIRRFWQSGKLFWSGDQKRIAWMMTAAVVVLVMAQIAISYRINVWNREIFDAMQARGRDPSTLDITVLAEVRQQAGFDPARLARMVATLRHRGPDDHGEVVAGPAAIGAARLSIIDVDGGHQPIAIDGVGLSILISPATG